jgi:cyclopropane-fatty-acyl-phospholipid synthase
MKRGNYWERYWSNHVHGGHRSQEEDFLLKEGMEKLFHLGAIPDRDSLLDFGCGSGDLLIYYAPHFKKVVGVDFSESMLKRAKSRVNERGLENISLIHADDNSIWEKINEDFDIITTAGVIQYLNISQIENFIKKSKEFLRPKGKVMLFDIIDPRIFFLFELGIFQQKKIGIFRIIKSVLILAIYRLMRKLKGLPKNEMGYGHLPHDIIELASRYGFSTQYCCSIYYEYRYHLILTPNV